MEYWDKVLGICYIIIVVTDEFRIAEINELVGLGRTDEVHGVREIACLDSIESDVKLEALVFIVPTLTNVCVKR